MKVEERVPRGHPKLLSLGQKYSCRTPFYAPDKLTQWVQGLEIPKSKKPTKLKDMVMDEKAAKGSKGVQVIVRYPRPFYSRHSRIAFVAHSNITTCDMEKGGEEVYQG